MKKREISPGMIGVVSLFFLFVFTTGVKADVICPIVDGVACP